VIDEVFAGVTAFGTLLTAGAVAVGVRQLRATERELELVQDQARTAFEDDLSREYRALIAEFPAEAFYGRREAELTEAFRRAFYRYFDLSNEQLFHIRNGRVSPSTAEQWLDGIKGNLSLPAFLAAWIDLEPHLRQDFFEDLRPVAQAVRAAQARD
jgi:hypothetical protein